nr:Rz1 family lipoprotein [Pseudohongiella acticola]
MPALRAIGCAVLLLTINASCASRPPVQIPVAVKCEAPPPPPAWMMQPAPDLLGPLNGIISPSEIE